ncbi:sulfotransferase [Chitinophaga sp.]|uniref:sulfotransferase n=1 Tax=Chitinophaga sp. TaxID=1869181 RepID=UPI0031D67545
MMKNKVLVITGMHRSGTSLTTQWLQKCGLHIGEQFLGAGIGNTDGHFEDIDFVEAHRGILRKLTGNDEGLLNLDNICIPADQQNILQTLVEKKQAAQHQWGWKDPRTCLFLDVYREILPGAKYLVILRDYRSVVSSLLSRRFKQSAHRYAMKGGVARLIWDYFKQPYRKKQLLNNYGDIYLKAWITYNQRILQHLLLQPEESCLVIDQNRLPVTNRAIYNHLTITWEMDLRYYDFSKVYKGNLLSEEWDIAAYIKDKSLLENAETLQGALLLHTPY